MFSNYFKIALRNINKNRVFSFINIFGLAIGLAGCLLIFQYISFELSYNNFHENGENIYRISYSKEKDGIESFHTVLTYTGVGRRLKENFPEVVAFARLRPASTITSTSVIKYREDVFEENRVYFADPSFLTMFSYKIITGDPATTLIDPFTAVISETTAKKYFGEEDPIGKTFKQGDDNEFTITGVFEDIPPNSHVKFDFLLSHISLKGLMYEGWTEDNITSFHGHLYLQMDPNADIESFEAKLPGFVDEFVGGLSLKEEGTLLKLWVMALKDIHLHSNIQHESEINGDAATIKYLTIIAFIILFIAWVNYINLSTARAIERANEVGVRKVLGAQKKQLIKQFLFESALINLIAILFSLTLVALAQPLFSKLGADHLVNLNIWESLTFWMTVGILFVTGIIFSGIYPAFTLSGFKAVEVIKGGNYGRRQGNTLRRILVIFQFSASVCLIIGTTIVYLQINHMRNQELGVNLDRSLVVNAPLLADSTYGTQVQAFKTELLKNANIRNVVASFDIPGREFNSATWYKKITESDENAQFLYRTFVDEDFLASLEIEVIAGRGFQAADNNLSIILNEKALALFKYPTPEDALGNELTYIGSDGEIKLNIIGVVKNYHHLSPKLVHSPLLMRYNPGVRKYYIIQFNPGDDPGGNIPEVIDVTKGVYTNYFAGNPFNYFFLDDEFEKQYLADQSFGDFFSIFSILALVVASLGLFGLSSFTILRRTKEIGIKKVLGSSVAQILRSLSSDYLKLILLANIIAWPLIYYLMEQWLANFENHISIQWWLFPIAGIAVSLIALITVSFHTVKAATTNPVESLKYE
jgi:putative ABC transport system permease protein